MRSYNRFAAHKEKARHLCILRTHYNKRKPDKVWRHVARCCMVEPGWWVREFMSRPARIRANQLCHLIEMGRDPDGVLWPSHKRPHLYYW